MSTLQIKKLDNSITELPQEDIENLNYSLRGEVLTSAHESYHSARSIWNGLIDKHPALIVRCRGTVDVFHAVNFARENNLLVAVRSGGHNVAGNAICDDGLVIDLSAMKGIHVDPEARTAKVQAGADWGDLDKETQLHGLVTPGGQVSVTGVAGLTLGGGMGWIRRKWGLSCDNLISVEMVTADGRILTASENENEDLFWAVRGGGGNFGVVTSFEFRLHPLGPEIYGSLTIYPLAEATSVLRKWRDFVLDSPDEVTCDAMIWGMPPLPDVPPEMHWAPVLIIPGMYAGPVAKGERALKPGREMGTPIADMSGPQPYLAMQSDMDVMFPDGQLYYWKSLFADIINDDVIDKVVDLANKRPSPQCLIAIRSLGGAMGRIAEDATAYGNRDALFNISIDNTWQDPDQSETMIAWTREAWSSLRELTGGGVYINFLGLGEEKEVLSKAAYGRNYDRLQQVKAKYDPDNLFRVNQNITPTNGQTH